MACAQTTITIYANNEVGPSTCFYGGSYGESVCVKDDAENLLAYLKAGDVFVTDKGYYLRDLLMQRYGAHHLKPTEMAGGSGAGMTKEQCARSQVIAQIRSVTERVVLLFKRFDMFGGTAVHMNEWHMMDDYKDVITMLIMKKGPLSDHLRKKKLLTGWLNFPYHWHAQIAFQIRFFFLERSHPPAISPMVYLARPTSLPLSGGVLCAHSLQNVKMVFASDLCSRPLLLRPTATSLHFQVSQAPALRQFLCRHRT
jgi:hypothetical protein